MIIKDIYNLFDSHFDSLNLSEKIHQLFNGAIVNPTENQSAIHHAYRDAYSDSPNNLLSKDILDSCNESINICIKLKNDLLDRGIKNIVTIVIGGSFEGPKLLIETLTAEHERSFNHIFLTGPDVIEFSEMIEPLNQEETFFIVSSRPCKNKITGLISIKVLSKNIKGRPLFSAEVSRIAQLATT